MSTDEGDGGERSRSRSGSRSRFWNQHRASSIEHPGIDHGWGEECRVQSAEFREGRKEGGHSLSACGDAQAGCPSFQSQESGIGRSRSRFWNQHPASRNFASFALFCGYLTLSVRISPTSGFYANGVELQSPASRCAVRSLLTCAVPCEAFRRSMVAHAGVATCVNKLMGHQTRIEIPGDE